MKYGWTRTGKYSFAASVLVLLTASSAGAQTPAPDPSSAAKPASRLQSTLLFFSGAASGLAIHESGHVIFSAAFGANPRVLPLQDSPIPFFKIQHDPVTRRQEFAISSAGIWMQNAGSEWILTARPHLRDEHAPFQKGILAFNLATSTVYGVTAFVRKGPQERDTLGMAVSLGHTGVGEPVVGVIVLAPAVLDGYRYLHPEARWAAWASRAAKVTAVLLTFTAGR